MSYKELTNYKVKRINFDHFWYTHREAIIKFEEAGYSITEDLVPLMSMVLELKKNAYLSKSAKLRLKWMDYCQKHNNVSLTCRHFGISRKTFYLWKNRYDHDNLSSLEDRDRAPIKRRQREITATQEQRIVALRRQYIRYGKEKLSLIYQQLYHEPISAWKIQKTIERYKLYYNPSKTAKIARKRQRAIKKKRITELKKKKISGFLLCLDVIVIYWSGLKRYIFTAIDSLSKVAFAHMYSTKSSYNARDFLIRLNYLLDNQIDNIQTDNGSEFEKYFRGACQKLKIKRYYNRPQTPKDNPVNERFNQTLQHEFINLGNFTPDLKEFNKQMTEWLIEYNFRRPHQTLGYIPPIEFNQKYLKVLPMYPSRTCY